MRLTYRQIKEHREKLLKKQGGICPLCETPIKPEEATLDHCHTTGHCRAVLHRICNTAEGKILHWLRRARGEDPYTFLDNLQMYWREDIKGNPIHPRYDEELGRDKPRRSKARKSKRRTRSRKGIRS